MNTHQQAASAMNTGMALSEANANRHKQRWSEDAEAALLRYCLAHRGQDFLTEQVREWGESLDLVDAPFNAKAWGGVMRRSAANGVIRKVGYGPARSSHFSPKVLWQAI